MGEDILEQDERIPNVVTLKKRSDFLRLRTGRKFSSRNFTVQAAAVEDRPQGIRVGYTVTTKTGNAVVRNRIKRRLRQVARQVLPLKGLHGYDYVVIARHAALRSDYPALLNDFSLALDHIHGRSKKRSKKRVE